jgi:hypothetical protein
VAANQVTIGLQEARRFSEQKHATNAELRQEIIKRQCSEQRLAMQYAIARVLAECDTLAAATLGCWSAQRLRPLKADCVPRQMIPLRRSASPSATVRRLQPKVSAA